MRIVFGQRNFKIREFSPQELGFISDSSIDFNIEVRQNYFHIYWIPFCGTGKEWAIRRNGELYELPLEYHYHIQNRQLKIRSPWYTYTWLILIALGFLIYSSQEKIENYNRDQQDRVSFIESVGQFDTKIEKAKRNQFFVLEDLKDNNDQSKMYLKVEKVYADKIDFTVIPGFFLESSGLKLEECYDQNKAQLDKITVLKSELKNAFARDFDVSQSNTFTGSDLLKSRKAYRITSIEEGWSIVLESSLIFKDSAVIQIEISSTGSEFTIMSIQNTENHIPWDITLPLKIKSGNRSNPVNFFLSSKKKDDFSFYNNDSFKTEIKVLDSFGTEHLYQLSGNHDYCTLTKFS
ncbi:hypothetical protein EV144_103184 [Flavobacterium sp. 270]|uniref:hypothetical protein n=1 Tax=Flavobacterium sp. 270 TaxID=2512114 RepID=UPI001064FCE8|nr:hypothetical protein [Flavobacterium sp. 270]TDW48668.1 hypothetical protein EV144_103184 [Flavobacterium sp. 270]